MGRPAGVERATKNNDNKHPHVREEFTKGKKIGRKKQVWVWDDPKGVIVSTGTVEGGDLGRGTGTRVGHWEKVQ